MDKTAEQFLKTKYPAVLDMIKTHFGKVAISNLLDAMKEFRDYKQQSFCKCDNPIYMLQRRPRICQRCGKKVKLK
jgi:hypothetical protein